jgi:cell division protein FtsI (penicillin-binding protein 3)
MRRSDQVLPLEGASAPEDAHRVVRPETAATLRRLMEGVILHGTGKNARLDGWTAAGKTGTAQKIDPQTKRYSPTNVIASFTGFAPINNPAVTILVSIDSPGGYPHGGGDVAAPVFKRIAEQVLPYLDVPRDVPLSPRLIQTAYRTGGDASDSSDDLATVDFSAQAGSIDTDFREVEKPRTVLQKLPEVMVSADEGGGITVPDFSGKTMREVTESCLRLGLDPVLVGSSLASQQTPAAGSKVRHGAKIIVEFGGAVAKPGKQR